MIEKLYAGQGLVVGEGITMVEVVETAVDTTVEAAVLAAELGVKPAGWS